ncbi:MAG: hypothetical protein HY879_06400 [Deltaproteobacteria bacterium]|nr:hypothetical protein [Deltaproteobacteria bacterium]
MGAMQPQEQSFSNPVDFFSDPVQSLTEKGDLFEKGCPPPLWLALWLESFLMAGGGWLKKEWPRLSPEAQRVLGIEILKCYLYQPLFLRLSSEGRPATPGSKFILKRQGQLLQVEIGSGPARKIQFCYPLAHSRLWMDLLTVFEEELFSFREIFKNLEPGLRMASSSRLEAIRQRAETLHSFFLKWQGPSVFRSLKSDETTDQNIVPPSAPKPKKKGKGKSVPDQMKMF